MVITGSASERRPATSRVAGEDRAWDAIGWIGMAFILIGMVDLVLAWYPPALGSPEWEFGTIGASLNGLPLPALGIALNLAAGIARGSRWQMRAAAGFALAFALLLLVFAFIYATVIPVALADATNAVVRLGLLKSIAKAVVLLALYPVLFLWIGFRGWKQSSVKAT
jgi:hypothetical protein